MLNMAAMNADDASTLKELSWLISSSIETLCELQRFPGSTVSEQGTTNGILDGEQSGTGGRAKKEMSDLKDETKSLESENLPPREIFDVQRNLLAAAGKLTELVSTSSNRLLEVSSQYFEARALHIAVDKRIPDLLDAAPGGVMFIGALAAEVGIDPGKLCEYLPL